MRARDKSVQMLTVNEGTVVSAGQGCGYTMLRGGFNRTFNGHLFQVFIYGAYNALGLIGTENNGVVIGDVGNGYILSDKIDINESGFYGPTQKQEQTFDYLQCCTWTEFRQFVNRQKYTRYDLNDDGSMGVAHTPVY